MSFTIEEIAEAVETFYGKTTARSNDRRQAEGKLKRFQKANEAWVICHQVLSNPLEIYSDNFLFSVAQTLKIKLQFDFTELDEQSALQMNEAIIQYLSHLTERPRSVTNQLCLSYAILYLRIHNQLKEFNVMEFLQTHLSQNQIAVSLMIDIVKAFPEEASNSHVVIEKDVVRSFENLLDETIATHVFTMLDHVVRDKEKFNDLFLQWSVLECFNSWLEFGVSHTNLTFLESSELINFCFKSLEVQKHFEDAVQAIISLIKISKDITAHPQLAKIVIQKVMDLTGHCNAAFEKEEYEDLNDYARIFGKLGEVHASLIADQASGDVLNLLDVILNLSTLEQVNVDMWYRFWHTFCFQTARIKDKQSREAKSQVFGPYVLKLVPSLIKHSQLDETDMTDCNERGLENCKHLDETLILRDDIEKLLIDMVLIAGTEDMFNKILTCFKEELADIPLPNCSVEESCIIEAYIHGITALSRLAAEKCTNEFFAIVKEMMELNTQENYMIKRAIDVLLGVASKEMFRCPELLLTSLEFVTRSFDVSVLEECASKVFRDICQNNSTDLVGHLESLFTLFNNHTQNYYLLEGITSVITKVQSVEGFYGSLELICKPFASGLLASIEKYGAKNEDGVIPTHGPSDDVDFETKKVDEISDLFDLLTSIFKTIERSKPAEDQSQAIYQLVEKLWELLESLAHVFGYEENVCERMVRLIKHLMRSLGQKFENFIDRYVRIIVTNWNLYVHASLVYAAEYLVEPFGNNEKYFETFKNLFETLTQGAINKLQTRANCEDNLFLVEDFFGMSMRYLKVAPQVVVYSSNFEGLFACAMVGISLDRSAASDSLYTFINKVIQLADTKKVFDKEPNLSLEGKEIISKLLIAYGARLVDRFVKFVMETISETSQEIVEELLYRLTANFPQDSQNWFASAIERLPSDCLSDQEKQEFVIAIPKGSKREFGRQFDKLVIRCYNSALRSR